MYSNIRITVATSISAFIFLIVPTFCFAQSASDGFSFEEQLSVLGYDLPSFRKQSSVSRFDLTRLLSAVECQDCLAAPESLIQKYNQSVWESFVQLPGKDFQDVQYPRAEYNNKNYFLCVAYSADQGYVRGYPADTSRFCAGRFCGLRSTSWAEFLQVIVNILGKYTYQNFKVNRSEIEKWYATIPLGTYTKNTFTSADEQTLLSGRLECSTGECVLRSREQLQTYLKYCMFNLEKCGMKELPGFKRGVRPVAELNFLIKENVFDLDFLNTRDLNSPISAESMLALLKRLNLRVQCSFDNDYDCDRVLNAEDNCPNTYNPYQQNTDQDQYGDVCDDDIDGDGLKNPLGIVDSELKVRLQLMVSGMDNCLFVMNRDQKDLNANGYGDVCEDKSLALSFVPTFLKNKTPVVVQLQSFPSYTGVKRDLGDGTQKIGDGVIHTYFQPGYYTVRASRMDNPTVTAEQTLFIPEFSVIPHALRIQAGTVQSVRGNLTYALNVGSTGGNRVVWNVGGKISTRQVGEFVRGIFTGQGRVVITAQLFTGEASVGLSQFEIENSSVLQYARLDSTSLIVGLDQPIDIRTRIGGFSLSDVDNVRWDFDQGASQKIQNTKNLTMQTRYSTPGVKLVQQTVTLKNGLQFTSLMTLFVQSRESTPVAKSIFLTSGTGTRRGDVDIQSIQVSGNPSVLIHNSPDGISRIQQGNQLRLPTILKYTMSSFSALPKASLYAVYGQCSVFKSTISLSRGPQDICLDLKLRGKLNELRCDMDEDAIPDLCDDDIDGDGVLNLLGILRSEGSGCVHLSGDFEPLVLQQHFQRSCRLDNCPVDRNADQIDANINGKGDVCEYMLVGSGMQNNDLDEDGLVNDRDACVSLPENYNGFQDADGCPEVGEHDICVQKPYTQPVCVQCPCPYFDYGGDLLPGQQVRATLRDVSQRFLQGVGLPRRFEISTP